MNFGFRISDFGFMGARLSRFSRCFALRKADEFHTGVRMPANPQSAIRNPQSP